MVNYEYIFNIIDTLTGATAIDPALIQDDEEALLTLEVLNSGIAEAGGYPNFELRITPKMIIGG